MDPHAGTAQGRQVIGPMQVTSRPGEAFESLLRRFKSGVEREGILGDYKRHQTFMSRGEKARAKLKRAERKRRTRMARRAS
jgi:small subunit ribosomal protein S21